MILKAGAGATAQWNQGVAVFIEPKGGLMAGASVTGQTLTYHAKGSGG